MVTLATITYSWADFLSLSPMFEIFSSGETNLHFHLPNRRCRRRFWEALSLAISTKFY
jgi:hypothetical protein